MSCTTDRRRPAGRGGSILMEFVIVLPFYLLLLGVAVLLGDFALRSIWLTNGDILVAYAKGDNPEGKEASEGDSYRAATLAVKSYMFNLFKMDEKYSYETGADKPLDMAVSGGDKIVLLDSSFGGAWSYQVAGLAVDKYALPPWARGWLGYSEWTYRTQSGGGKEPEGPVFSKLLTDADEGRYRIVSRDLADAGGERRFGYYTLMRSRQGRDRKKPYRSWTPAELSAPKKNGSPVVGDYWYLCVYKEPIPDKDKKNGVVPTAEHLENGDDATVEFWNKPSGRGDYSRNVMMGYLSQ